MKSEVYSNIIGTGCDVNCNKNFLSAPIRPTILFDLVMSSQFGNTSSEFNGRDDILIYVYD